MFRCALTHKQSLPGERAVRIVVETRACSYPPQPARTRGHRGNMREVTDHGGVGREIVRELLLSQEAAAAFVDMSQEEIEAWFKVHHANLEASRKVVQGSSKSHAKKSKKAKAAELTEDSTSNGVE